MRPLLQIWSFNVPPYTSRYARMSDPACNYHFSRPWTEIAVPSWKLERASEVALATGNPHLADRLAWRAHAARVGEAQR